MKYPFEPTIDLSTKDAEWNGRPYTQVVNETAEVIAKEWSLEPRQQFDLNFVIANAFRAGIIAAQKEQKDK